MDSSFEWVVVGAGPAGIATVGLLLDAGVDGRRIGWIDPQFKVGDFGTAWRFVMSNTSARSFMDYYRASPSFQFDSERGRFAIEQLPPESRCLLMMATEPLAWVTKVLMGQVHSINGQVQRLTRQGRGWRVALGSGEILQTGAVVLAIGAEPKRLSFQDLEEIPLAAALNPMLLSDHVGDTDRVAIFGDAQSARSALQNLSKTKVKKVFHFYHSKRSVDHHLANEDMSEVESLPNTSSNLLSNLPHCNKAIYAIGFSGRRVQVDHLPADFRHDTETGVIAEGLFGAGIAFPSIFHHHGGRPEYHVSALKPVMSALKQRLPLWLNTA